MINYDLINDFKTEVPNLLPFWQEECRDDELIFALIKGSTVINQTDERSDIDIQLTTHNTYTSNTQYYANFKGRQAHWWIQTLNMSWWPPSESKYTMLLYAGLYQWKFTDENCILYENPCYPNCWSIISQYKDRIAYLGLVYFVLFNEVRLRTKCPEIIKSDWILLDYWYDMHHLEKDQSFWDFVYRIRRKKYTKDESLKIIDIRYEVYQKIIQENTRINYSALWIETMSSFEHDIEGLRLC